MSPRPARSGFHGLGTLHSAGSAIRSGLRENLQKQLFGVIGNIHLGPLLLHKRSQKNAGKWSFFDGPIIYLYIYADVPHLHIYAYVG